MKVLIWDKLTTLKNSGGASGYMWNIKSYIDSNHPNINNVYFYSDIISKNDSAQNLICRLLLTILYKLKFNIFARFINDYFYIGALSREEKRIIKNFDFVHFHNLSMAHAYCRKVKRLGVRTIITTHTPEPNIDEICALNYFLRKHLRDKPFLRNWFIHRELDIFDGCDYIMFPVKDVLECYTSVSDLYKRYFDNVCRDKLFYVPTAIIDNKSSKNEHILNDLQLPANSKYICYIGRHNTVKGYDYLKEIAKKIFEQRKNIYFIIGGKVEDITPLDSSNWIELGWVNTSNLLKEIDVFVLANQQTYFDIIALEILRAGVPLITTLTGGNKYIEKINNGGVTIIPKNNVDEAAKILLDVLDSDKSTLGFLSRQLYENHFSVNEYIHKYIKELNKLNGKKYKC